MKKETGVIVAIMVIMVGVILSSGCINDEPVEAPFNHSDDQDILPYYARGTMPLSLRISPLVRISAFHSGGDLHPFP